MQRCEELQRVWMMTCLYQPKTKSYHALMNQCQNSFILSPPLISEAIIVSDGDEKGFVPEICFYQFVYMGGLMFYVCIRSFFINWIAFNAYEHMVHARKGISWKKNAAMSIVLALLVYYPYMKTETFSSPLSLLGFGLVILFVHRNGGWITFVVGMLAYGIGYVLYSISGGLILIFYRMINTGNWDNGNKVAHMVAGVLSLLLCGSIFKIRRLRKGLQLDTKSPIFKTSLIVAGLLCGCILAANRRRYTSDAVKSLYFFIISSLGFLFFAIWKYLIKSYYMKRIRTLELESLRQELEEKDARIRKLEESNDALAQIIHRDNKLIPAMERSVCEFLRSAADLAEPLAERGNRLPEPLAERGNKLAEALEDMAQGRQGILRAYEDARVSVARTGHLPVDAMLTYMHDRAKERHIEYEVKINPGFSAVIPEQISEADAAHLLSDLIENAMIATRRSGRRAVLVNLSILDNALVIEVSDSGAGFDPDVYQDFGMYKHSTHLHEGGSGIGLLDIWACKKKYKASLHIYEYMPESGAYTKKIALVFDGKDRYLICTHRASELEANKVRADLFVLPLQ